MQKHNPQVNIYTGYDALDDGDMLMTSDDDWMMAFAIEDFVSLEPKTDPRFLKWQTVYLQVKDGITVSARSIPNYPCTEEDFKRFNKVEKRSKSRYKELKEGGSLQCIDWVNQDIQIYGSESSGTYGAIDVMVVPCHMGYLYWADDEFIPPEGNCETDRTKAIEYLNNLQMVVVYNNGRFLVDEFEGKEVQKITSVSKIQVDSVRANYVTSFVNIN